MPPLSYLSHQIGRYVSAATCCTRGAGPRTGAGRRDGAARHAHDLVLAPAARAARSGWCAPRGDALPDHDPWTAPFWTRVDGADDAKPTRSAPVPVAQLWTAVDAATDDDGAVPLPPYAGACWQAVLI